MAAIRELQTAASGDALINRRVGDEELVSAGRRETVLASSPDYYLPNCCASTGKGRPIRVIEGSVEMPIQEVKISCVA